MFSSGFSDSLTFVVYPLGYGRLRYYTLAESAVNQYFRSGEPRAPSGSHKGAVGMEASGAATDCFQGQMLYSVLNL